MYRPMQEAEQLVIDAVNVRLTALHNAPEEELRESVLGFVQKYGFLGFMTALPTTADFIAYESVYLPKKNPSLQKTIFPIFILLTCWISERKTLNRDGL